MAIVTETWLTDGESLLLDVEDLEHGAGLGMLFRNRKKNSRGFSHGGVAIMYKKSCLNMKELIVPNPDSFEVLGAVGNLLGHSRKIVTLACYIPPNYAVGRGKDCLAYITDLVLHLKRTYKDPYIIVGGDFNQWDLSRALEDYP